MKLFFTSLILFLLFSCRLNSQNYRMVNTNSEFFFITNNISLNDEVFGLKCDSVKNVSSDSIYYPYRTLKQVSNTNYCNMDPNYPIWAGSEIVVDSNNVHKWLTLSGDSLVINSKTNPGDTQQVYLYGNGNKIIAIHFSNTQMTFANITDSVKNYILQTLDPLGNNISNWWNGKQIIISKNNGVVQMPTVTDFPNDTTIFSRVDAKRLKYGDCYPWQTGDELHENLYWSNMSGQYHTYTYNHYILARTLINTDSVDFTIRTVTHYVTNAPPTNIIFTDTLILGVGNLTSFIESKMPQQTIDSTKTYDLFLNPSDCGKLRMVDHVITLVNKDTGCVYQQPQLDAYTHDNIYVDGVAGYYFAESPNQSNSNSWETYDYVYSSIGASTCGTPLYIGIQEINEAHFHIWPNPTTDFLNFDFSGNYSGYTFTIFDLAGKQIQTVRLEKNVPVDVRNLANGFYVGKIISPNGNQQNIIRFVKN